MENCKAPGIAAAVEGLRRSLDRDTPDWTEHVYFCRWCQDEHIIHSEDRQLSIVAGRDHEAAARPKGQSLPAIPVEASENYCRWHRTSSPQMAAPCAFCGTELHVHQDALGSVKSGRAGQGFLIQKCICRRENAVMPVYGKKAIRTAKLEDGKPVLQLSLV